MTSYMITIQKESFGQGFIYDYYTETMCKVMSLYMITLQKQYVGHDMIYDYYTETMCKVITS